MVAGVRLARPCPRHVGDPAAGEVHALELGQDGVNGLAALTQSGGGFVTPEAADRADHDVLLGGEHRPQRSLAEALDLAGWVVGKDVEVGAGALQRHGLLSLHGAALVVEGQTFHPREEALVVEAGDQDVLLEAPLGQSEADFAAGVGLEAGDGEEPLRAEALPKLRDGLPSGLRSQGGEAADPGGGAHHAELLEGREMFFFGRKLLYQGAVDLVPEFSGPSRDAPPGGLGGLVGLVPKSGLGGVADREVCQCVSGRASF